MGEQNNELMAEQIRATNRATRAIRALVRFLLVQLLFITGAALLIFFGELAVGDSVECTLYGDECGARPVFQILAGLTFLVGVVLSSRIAWAELALSDPGLESNPMPINILSAPEFKPGSEFLVRQNVSPGGESAPPSGMTEPCPKCKSQIELGSKFCTSCGTRFAN
jgi:hypothetical protein